MTPFGPTPAALAACAIGGYLLGSISFGLIVTRFAGAGDLRAMGSGNIGATNVLRTGRRDLALVTLLGDAGKGAAAVLLASWLVSPAGAALAGGAAYVGHCFPVWLGFRGGKGVATFFGVLLALVWPVGLIAGAIWLGMAALTRVSSVASLTAAAVAPVILVALGRSSPERLILLIAMAALIFIRHHENIGRLLRGEEPRLGRARP